MGYIQYSIKWFAAASISQHQKNGFLSSIYMNQMG
jgi:hypothetical protein